MKTVELTGCKLDYWVARAEELPLSIDWDQGEYVIAELAGEFRRFSPSTDWLQGGPIIEREIIQLVPVRPSGKTWHAIISHGVIEQENGYPDLSGVTVFRGKGQTPLIAAMRSHVASKFGDDVPEIE